MSKGEGVRFFQKIFCHNKYILQKIIKKMLQYAYCNPKCWVETIYPRKTGTTSLLDL